MNHYASRGLSRGQKDALAFVSGAKVLGACGIFVHFLNLSTSYPRRGLLRVEVAETNMYLVGLGCCFLAGVVGLQLVSIYLDHLPVFIVSGFLVLLLDVLFFLVFLLASAYGIGGSLLMTFILVIQVWVMTSATRILFEGGRVAGEYQKFPQRTSQGLA